MGREVSLIGSEQGIREQTLALLHKIAAHALAQAAPIRFAIAQTPAELEAVYRLRYNAVIERGWAAPEEFPTGLEQDAFDDRGLHIAAWDAGTLAGALRLIFPAPGQLLPTEEDFSIRIEPQGQVVEVGRVIVARSHSDSRHRIFAALTARACLEISTRGFCYACGAANRSMLRLYRQIGYHVTLFGPAHAYWGELRQPVRFDFLESAPSLRKRWLKNT